MPSRPKGSVCKGGGRVPTPSVARVASCRTPATDPIRMTGIAPTIFSGLCSSEHITVYETFHAAGIPMFHGRAGEAIRAHLSGSTMVHPMR
jgi:hypothetical protein